MKLKLLVLIAGLLLGNKLLSQDFKNSVGFRGGYSYGFTYTMFTDENKEAEALLSFRDGGMQCAVFVKKFKPVLLEYSDHFYLHYGIGGHLGYTSWEKGFKTSENGYDHYEFRNYFSPVIGADFSATLQYRFYRYPFSIALDYKPFFELPGRHFFRLNLWDTALCIKYNF